MSLQTRSPRRVQYNGQPSAIFQPIDAADRSIQPLVSYLWRSIVYATVILYCWSFNEYYYSYYYCHTVSFIINAMQSLLKPFTLSKHQLDMHA